MGTSEEHENIHGETTMLTIIEPKGYHRVMQAVKMWQRHEITWKECLRLCDLDNEQVTILDEIVREMAPSKVEKIVRKAID